MFDISLGEINFPLSSELPKDPNLALNHAVKLAESFSWNPVFAVLASTDNLDRKLG